MKTVALDDSSRTEVAGDGASPVAAVPRVSDKRAPARPMTVLDFQKMKDEGRKISMATCYDYSSARAVAGSNVDCILVGDSLAMTMHGYPTTLSATTAMMALHTAAVARGAPSKFIVADLPFLSYRKGLKDAMNAVQELMSAGAHAVKVAVAESMTCLMRRLHALADVG